MKTVYISFFIFLFSLFLPAFSLAQEESPSPTPIPTTSYEIFYPIVAGKVRGDSLYFLKILREKIVDLLIFSPIKKADYHLILSKKRLVETEKLISDGKTTNAEKTIEKSVEEFRKALEITNKATKKGIKTVDLYNTLFGEGTKEKNFIKTMAGENNKLNEAVSSFESLLEEVNSKRN